MKKFAVSLLVAGGLVASATAANAAQLEFIDTDADSASFDMIVPGFNGIDTDPIESFLGISDFATDPEADGRKFQANTDSYDAGDGLAISNITAGDIAKGTVDIAFTFFGSEASFENVAVATSGGAIELFNNTTSTAGETKKVSFDVSGLSVGDSFLIPFVFQTFGNGFPSQQGEYDNTAGFSGANDEIEVGFSEIVSLFGFDRAVAYFGDGTGDTDLDDLVIGISVVPLPAPLVLLGSALLGLGLVSRLRKQ